MHTRRISTFLLGAWLAGSLILIFLEVLASHSPSSLLSAPAESARAMIDSLGADKASLLLRYAAHEQTRTAYFNWELIQIPLALLLMGCLYLATQKRAFPMVLCGAMLVLVLFQHFGVAAELAYRGRETDFPPGNETVGLIERLRAMQMVYYGIEVVKLIAGGILASYLFVFRSSSRKRVRKEVDLVDDADHRHVNG